MSRLIFFGSPEFALPTLERLCAEGRSPDLVVSQPARPLGRGRKLRDPPVAAWAKERGLEVSQPERVGSEPFLERIRELNPRVAVVVAFGQIFRSDLLGIPELGCVNLHGSLLPRYRGAAPIQASIMAGDTVTGVTTMQMEKGLDTGPILKQAELAIGRNETAGELAVRLAQLGAPLMAETLEELEKGTLVPRQQDDSLATVARRLRKSDGLIDWDLDAVSIFNRLRGLTPWPGLAATLRGAPLKVLWAQPAGVSEQGSKGSEGTIVGLSAEGVEVACGNSQLLRLERLQRPGRKPVAARDLVNAEHIEVGERFG